MDGFKLTGKYIWELERNGKIIWSEEKNNMIVNQGLNHFLDVVLSDGTPDSTHYIGLKGSGIISVSDTLASHGGWSEITNYSGDRKEWVEAGVASQSISNSASTADFTFTSNSTIYGAFLCSVASGSTGTLISVSNFSLEQDVLIADILHVTYTMSISSV